MPAMKPTHRDYIGTRVDYIGLFQVGVPVDIGWGIAVVHDDQTVSRTCKGCGVSIRTPYDPITRKVAEASIVHEPQCRVVPPNNPIRS
jgi:hypothetical protein